MIKEYLHNCSDLVEKRINELLPEIKAGYTIVNDAARYSLLMGGKRIRPAITLLFCELFGGKKEDAVDFAIALEMVHTYSLIHDDLPCMDNDDIRRGKPSCHKQFGEDIALLAGDTLLTQSFSVIANSDASDYKKVMATAVLSECAGLHGMIGGQVLDLDFENNTPDDKSLLDMYKRKTAALLVCAAKLGMISAGITSKDIFAVAEDFSINLGLAFQVIDDILDCIADEAVLGKPVGSDKKNKKTTFVSLFGIEKSREIASNLTEEALNALEKLDGDTALLKELTAFLLDRNY